MDGLLSVPLESLLHLLTQNEMHHLVRAMEQDPMNTWVGQERMLRITGFDAIRHLDFGPGRFTDRESYERWKWFREGMIKGDLDTEEVIQRYEFSESREMEEVFVVGRMTPSLRPAGPSRITITARPALPWSDPDSDPMGDLRRAAAPRFVGDLPVFGSGAKYDRR